jgi:hypothetical protein
MHSEEEIACARLRRRPLRNSFRLLGICSTHLNLPIALRSSATAGRNTGGRTLTGAVYLALDSGL